MVSLLNINQTAYVLKVHPLTIRRYIKEGKLKAVKVGGSIRIRETDLEAFSKDYEPQPRSQRASADRKLPLSKPFTADDPLLSLEGRGASLQLGDTS